MGGVPPRSISLPPHSTLVLDGSSTMNQAQVRLKIPAMAPGLPQTDILLKSMYTDFLLVLIIYLFELKGKASPYF